MPLSQLTPTVAAGQTADTLLITLGPETRTISLSDIGDVIDGRRRDDEAIVAQLANLMVGNFPTKDAALAATPAQIQAIVNAAPFYW